MTQRFTTQLRRSSKGVWIDLPFDPDAVWRKRSRHHVHGTIAGCKFRGELEHEVIWTLHLGPAWLRDNPVPDEADVAISPEGHLAENLPTDVKDALEKDDRIRDFFESLPGFYRNNFIRAIEQAKRPETRGKRIEEMINLLLAGKQEKT